MTQTKESRLRRAANRMARMRALVLENPWIPIEPSERQAEFLLDDDREVMYGGAAGGGKSSAILAAALMYVDYPDYAALILRRSYKDLSLPGALMDLAHEWLNGTAARWLANEKTWEFPSGATLTFGYLDAEKDKYRYQGAAFQYVGMDELTQFERSQYLYLFSRLRRLAGTDIPIRMRSGSNPGGTGHDWVKARFIDGEKRFIPARLEDNPYLDREEYEHSLIELDHITRAQLRQGDWGVRPEGGLFKRRWFTVLDQLPDPADVTVRFWDLAATSPAPGKDPDYTVGAKLTRTRAGLYVVEHIVRVRERPHAVEQIIKHTAEADGPNVRIWMEQEPGSSGVNTIDTYRRRVLPGWEFRGIRSTGDKEVNARPLSSQAESGAVYILRGPWNEALLDELEGFPEVNHDDQVDAVSKAFKLIHARPVRTPPPPSKSASVFAG